MIEIFDEYLVVFDETLFPFYKHMIIIMLWLSEWFLSWVEQIIIFEMDVRDIFYLKKSANIFWSWSWEDGAPKRSPPSTQSEKSSWVTSTISGRSGGSIPPLATRTTTIGPFQASASLSWQLVLSSQGCLANNPEPWKIIIT